MSIRSNDEDESFLNWDGKPTLFDDDMEEQEDEEEDEEEGLEDL